MSSEASRVCRQKLETTVSRMDRDHSGHTSSASKTPSLSSSMSSSRSHPSWSSSRLRRRCPSGHESSWLLKPSPFCQGLHQPCSRRHQGQKMARGGWMGHASIPSLMPSSSSSVSSPTPPFSSPASLQPSPSWSVFWLEDQFKAD